MHKRSTHVRCVRSGPLLFQKHSPQDHPVAVVFGLPSNTSRLPLDAHHTLIHNNQPASHALKSHFPSPSLVSDFAENLFTLRYPQAYSRDGLSFTISVRHFVTTVGGVDPSRDY